MDLVPELTEQAKSLSGTTARPVEGQKQAFIVTGPPASGKSSAVAEPLAARYNAAIVDPDEAKKVMPEFLEGYGANAVHQPSKAMAEAVQKNLMADNYNLVIPTVGEDAGKIANKAQQLRDAGYEVNLINMTVPTDEAMNRALMRSAKTGRHIPMRVLEGYGTKPEQAFQQLQGSPMFMRSGVVDNSVPRGQQMPVRGDVSLFDMMEQYIPYQ